MSHASKRLAGHQFANHWKHKIMCPGYAEVDCPWWDADWWDHCQMEAVTSIVQPVQNVCTTPQAILPETPVLLAPVPQPLLLPAWCASTSPLRIAAYRKEQQLLLRIPASADCSPVYSSIVKLATIRDGDDYKRTMKIYRIRLKARGTRRKDWARRLWDRESVATVLATRRPCPTIS